MDKLSELCIVEGCDNKKHARGWCNKHYGNWYRNGNPLKGNPEYQTPEESFEARTMPVTETGCILWTGAVSGKGYGVIIVCSKNVYVHRYAWEREHGPIPEGMLVDHKDHCSKSCVNVEHLRLATHAQNVHNQAGVRSNNTSGYTNVYFDGIHSKWFVAIVKEGIRNWFGYYDDLEEAAKVAEEKRIELFGEFAGRGYI